MFHIAWRVVRMNSPSGQLSSESEITAHTTFLRSDCVPWRAPLLESCMLSLRSRSIHHSDNICTRRMLFVLRPWPCVDPLKCGNCYLGSAIYHF